MNNDNTEQNESKNTRKKSTVKTAVKKKQQFSSIKLN